MAKSISASIALHKIDKKLIIKGKDGASYINIAIYENDEPDNYGNTHSIKQQAPKEKYEKGMKTPYIGNGKVWGERNQSAEPDGGSQAEDEDDQIPF